VAEAGFGVTTTAPSLPVLASSARRPSARETLRLYAGDWADFANWCRAANLAPMPAVATTIVAYLAARETILSHGALARRLAAIGAEHRRRGLSPLAPDPAIRAILRAARAARRPRRPKQPSAAVLARMAVACTGDLAGLRDRALLLLAAIGFGAETARRAATGDGAVVRGTLLALDVEEIRFTESGMDVGIGLHIVTVPRAPSRLHCPVRAMEDWLRASDSRFGPVFRKVDRWGNVEHRRLGTDAIRRILAHRALKRRAPRRLKLGTD